MKQHINTLLISLSIISAAFFLGNAYQNRNKKNNHISVTGLGEKSFTSNLIVWNGSFNKRNLSLKDAYQELDNDRADIKNYLLSKGLKENEMVFSSIDIDKEYNTNYDTYGNRISSTFTGYKLHQSIKIESFAVDTVEKISRTISELINSGIEFYSESPSYYYTKLAELKIQMIAEATKDANERAIKISENAGSEIGKLVKADMGVFQIVAQNSAEEYSWGGSFNTWSKRKTATVTVKLVYETK
jgi:hypothetical protein